VEYSLHVLYVLLYEYKMNKQTIRIINNELVFLKWLLEKIKEKRKIYPGLQILQYPVSERIKELKMEL